MYRLHKDIFGNQANHVERITDNVFIPFDDANTDFIKYKKWLAEGNEPEPADATPVADTQGEQ